MKYSLSQTISNEKVEERLYLDLVLEGEEVLVIDKQVRANGKTVLYLHLGAHTVVRVQGTHRQIVDA